MNSNSPLGAIPALIGTIMASRRAKAAARTPAAKPVRLLDEALTTALIGAMVAMVGFGAPHEIAGKVLAAALALRFVLQTLRLGRVAPKHVIGDAPDLVAYLVTAAAALIVFVGAFINSDAYGLIFVLTAAFVVRLLWRVLPLVHRTMMQRYAGHVARMEAEQAARKR